jgi:photosystem II stability/assembly factor-like uncharacterized protein
MRLSILISFTLLMVPASCGRLPVEKRPAEQGVPDAPAAIELIGRESHLDQSAPSFWSFREIRLDVQHALEAVYFSDEKNGWVGGAQGTLYRTVDGGENWQSIKLNAPAEMVVQNIFFLNDLTGWVVLQKPRDLTVDHDQPNFRLMCTRDGGRNWELQYQDSKVGITQLAFVDKENGWLAGVAYQRADSNSYFILHTRDQGRHWEDASLSLKSAAANDTNNLNQGVMGVVFSEGSSIVMTSELNLYRTSNEGRSWVGIGSVQNRFGVTSVVRRLGVTTGKALWSIGGSSSSHSGTRGVLFAQKDEHSWMKYVLGDVFFEDAVSLSNDRFLAVGFLVKDAKMEKSYRTLSEAVVLSSIDNGKNWEIAYYNPKLSSINCISLVNDSLAWAAGQNGIVIKLEKNR